ncbi:hypothetical protein FDF15_13600 [Clostridium botulinum]|uniref:hypothetical protein n=1 Tax=Clostridium botulinum TaxID=1491 RepID=UPI0013F06510|nr:hypothetical protein [Clostridium botulinum]MBY6996497.1 hypothetical protein [Clostridium botulinum]MBY7011158.1 hypothetical protein [Clostridium botulinum]MCR1153610.1 hypothetical protein [Clostridium botulinum]MCS6165704.1 hypothetical protein [Clostridium botulinum]NEZ76213.1 hypothetical protein [Clostridium botulinum]
MKYIKRTSKKLRQELLNKALREELEKLRKRFYPYKKRDFLFNDIEIQEKNFLNEEGMENTLGLYEYDKENSKHIIHIHKLSILDVQKVPIAYYRRYHYKKLKRVLRHELIHAFAYENYEWKCNSFIIGKEKDSSPIFLALLYFANSHTSHDCIVGFQKTDLYKKVMSNYFKKYEDLEEYLNNYLLEYSEAINEIKEISNKENFIKGKCQNVFSIKNTFEFAPRENGLIKFSETTGEDVYKISNKLEKYKMTTRNWYIGCNIEPNRLLELYNRKEDCDPRYYITKKQLVTIKNINTEILTTEDMKTIILKEEKNF